MLGELKSRLNGDNTDLQDTDPKTRPQLPLNNSNPDQLVNKLVYTQYRGMLNSYRNNTGL